MANQKPLCPKCGKQMILTGTGITLTSYPPQYPQVWWCGCGHQEPGPTLRGKTEEEVRREAWERANDPHTP